MDLVEISWFYLKQTSYIICVLNYPQCLILACLLHPAAQWLQPYKNNDTLLCFLLLLLSKVCAVKLAAKL